MKYGYIDSAERLTKSVRVMFLKIILVVVVAFTLGALFTIMATERDAEQFVCFPRTYTGATE